MKNSLKIHFIYVTGILVATIIVIITVEWSQIKELVSYINFGLTLTSLFLALIAIVYAFFSNSSFSQNISTLTNASHNIEKASEIINSSTEELNNRIEKIPSLLESLEKKSDDTIKLLKESRRDKNEVVDISFDDKEVHDFLNSNSVSGLLVIYTLKLSFENNKQYSLKELSELQVSYDFEYAQGYLIPLSGFGLYTFDEIERKDGDFDHLVTHLDERLNNNIESVLKKYDDELKKDTIDLGILESMKKLKDYFSQK